MGGSGYVIAGRGGASVAHLNGDGVRQDIEHVFVGGIIAGADYKGLNHADLTQHEFQGRAFVPIDSRANLPGSSRCSECEPRRVGPHRDLNGRFYPANEIARGQAVVDRRRKTLAFHEHTSYAFERGFQVPTGIVDRISQEPGAIVSERNPFPLNFKAVISHVNAIQLDSVLQIDQGAATHNRQKHTLRNGQLAQKPRGLTRNFGLLGAIGNRGQRAVEIQRKKNVFALPKQCKNCRDVGPKRLAQRQSPEAMANVSRSEKQRPAFSTFNRVRITLTAHA